MSMVLHCRRTTYESLFCAICGHARPGSSAEGGLEMRLRWASSCVARLHKQRRVYSSRQPSRKPNHRCADRNTAQYGSRGQGGRRGGQPAARITHPTASADAYVPMQRARRATTPAGTSCCGSRRPSKSYGARRRSSRLSHPHKVLQHASMVSPACPRSAGS
jgi:hypothetical protein